MTGGVWIFAEQRDGQLRKVTYELLAAGRRFADATGQELAAVLLGSGMAGLTGEIAQYGVDKVYMADHQDLGTYSTDGYTTVLAEAIQRYQPSALFLGHTAIGKDLAPRVAERMKTGLCTDCTAVDIQEGRFVFTRPIYAGKAFAKVECPTARPVMATIRPNVLGAGQPTGNRNPQVIPLAVNLGPNSIRTLVREMVKKAGGRVELTEADIIVSGGRGMKDPANFKLLEDLADVLGAAVGASRAAVDAGWREHQYQVGQTGKTVSPTLYIACGISGAIQHLAGMSSSKCIVAINKDPEANIFKVADYGIVDDLFRVLPVLTEEFKRMLA